MKGRARELSKRAQKTRTSGQLVEAGNLYTASAYEYAGEVTEHRFPEPDRTYSAVAELVNAATCYRIAGLQSDVHNRCEIGILLAEDYFEYINGCEIEDGSFGDVRRGAWPEYIGDFRTIARRENADDAYEQAIAIYQAAGDWEIAYAEQEHSRLAAYFRNLQYGLGQEIPETAPEQLGFGTTFAEWVEYKRNRLPSLLERLENQGSWPAE